MRKYSYVPLWLTARKAGVAYYSPGTAIYGQSLPMPRPVTIRRRDDGIIVVKAHRRSPWAILKGWLR